MPSSFHCIFQKYTGCKACTVCADYVRTQIHNQSLSTDQRFVQMMYREVSVSLSDIKGFGKRVVFMITISKVFHVGVEHVYYHSTNNCY